MSATQDEMEFLSVGLDKQPQFRSRTTETNPQKTATRRDARYSLLPFEPPPSPTPRIPPVHRESLIFGTSLVSLRVQLLVQSCALYLPLYRRFYCDRLGRLPRLFLFPYFPQPCPYISLILSPLRSGAATCTQRLVTAARIRSLFTESQLSLRSARLIFPCHLFQSPVPSRSYLRVSP